MTDSADGDFLPNFRDPDEDDAAEEPQASLSSEPPPPSGTDNVSGAADEHAHLPVEEAPHAGDHVVRVFFPDSLEQPAGEDTDEFVPVKISPRDPTPLPDRTTTYGELPLSPASPQDATRETVMPPLELLPDETPTVVHLMEIPVVEPSASAQARRAPYGCVLALGVLLVLAALAGTGTVLLNPGLIMGSVSGTPSAPSLLAAPPSATPALVVTQYITATPAPHGILLTPTELPPRTEIPLIQPTPAP
ncbi:MAG: hypothetical protein IT326_05450 [Anaerolineae bacterium]|nr:hypothetical protein [Anaerolineae bacterium]